MSAHIRYAYLKGHTWLYRRNYPVDVALALGAQALKQSLKTSDRNTARVRAAEVNARFETVVEQVRSQAEETLTVNQQNSKMTPLNSERRKILCKAHLRKNEPTKCGFKSAQVMTVVSSRCHFVSAWEKLKSRKERLFQHR